jgi:hypothetical protein
VNENSVVGGTRTGISLITKRKHENSLDLLPFPNPPNLAARVSFHARARRLAFLRTESFSVRTAGFVSVVADWTATGFAYPDR